MKLKTLFVMVAILLLSIIGQDRVRADDQAGSLQNQNNSQQTQNSTVSAPQSPAADPNAGSGGNQDIPLLQIPSAVSSQSASQSTTKPAPVKNKVRQNVPPNPPAAKQPIGQSPAAQQNVSSPAASNSASSDPATIVSGFSAIAAQQPTSGFNYAQKKFSAKTTAVLYGGAAILAVIGFALATARQRRRNIAGNTVRTQAFNPDSVTIAN